MIHVGVTSDGKHALEFLRGTLILSDAQLDRLGELLGIEDLDDRAAVQSELTTKLRKGHNWRKHLAGTGLEAPPSCVWNLLLRRRYAARQTNSEASICS